VPKTTALNVSWREINALDLDSADHHIQYGKAAEQFGELRLPKKPGPHPVIIFIHGGCWLNAYGLDHVGPMARALADEGYAVWTPEYRRIGDAGGGWPGTFEDIARSAKVIREFAPEHGLRLDRVIAMGHSAGGHLALWLAARRNLAASSNFYNNHALPLHGVVALAGIANLLAYEKVGNDCSASLPGLLGGTSAEVPERWAQADPMQLLPFGIPIKLIHGSRDSVVPLAQGRDMAKASGGELIVVEGAGHFDMVSPHADAWHIIRQAVRDIQQ
jgi:acetyl esterase/lipase